MSLSFNRDLQLLVTAIPEPQGYRVFLLDGSMCDMLHSHVGKKIYLIGCVLNCLVGFIVLQDSRKQLLMCDLEKDKILSRKVYESEILAVKMSPANIVVIFEDQIIIHNNIEDISVGRYENIPLNPNGICALAEEVPYFAYPWYKNEKDTSVETLNSVQVIDISVEPKEIITTIYQKNLPNIAAIGLNKTGKLMATANTEGKLIRVFDVMSGQMITEFHRGLFQATVNLLWFSICGKYLVSTSDSKTVHVFLLNQDKDDSLGQRFVGLLPKKAQERATELFNPNSSFGKAELILEQGGTGSVCGIKTVGKQTKLLVATPSGNLYVFILPEEKGDCEHQETFDLRFTSIKKTTLYHDFSLYKTMQIDDSTKKESLVAKAAGNVSKLAERASSYVSAAAADAFSLAPAASTSNIVTSTLGAGASTSSAGGTTSTVGATTSSAGASTSTAGASTSTAVTSTSTARTSTSTAGASISIRGSTASSAGASTSTAGASTSTAVTSTSIARTSTFTAGASTSTTRASTSAAGTSTSTAVTSSLTAEASTLTAEASTSTPEVSTSETEALTSTAKASISTAEASTSTVEAATSTAEASISTAEASTSTVEAATSTAEASTLAACVSTSAASSSLATPVFSLIASSDASSDDEEETAL